MKKVDTNTGLKLTDFAGDVLNIDKNGGWIEFSINDSDTFKSVVVERDGAIALITLINNYLNLGIRKIPHE